MPKFDTNNYLVGHASLKSHRYQNTLPDLIASRDEPHLTHEELAKLMKWKLIVKKISCMQPALWNPHTMIVGRLFIAFH